MGIGGYVYPACAGIHRLTIFILIMTRCLPRMRGDPPVPQVHAGILSPSTPHARGSTPLPEDKRRLAEVYPACAGIHLFLLKGERAEKCLPRMRGDPPTSNSCPRRIFTSTPHARGSTPGTRGTRNQGNVYPACAGIHLNNKNYRKRLQGLPRMRGDPPSIHHGIRYPQQSTPHARGST